LPEASEVNYGELLFNEFRVTVYADEKSYRDD
jgi:hypothetical protein